MGLRYFIAVECTQVRNSQSLELSQTCIGLVVYAVPPLFLRRLFQTYHPLPCSTDLLVSHTVYCTSWVLLPHHVTAMFLNGHILPLTRAHGCWWDVWQMLQEGRVHMYVFWHSVLQTSPSYDLALTLCYKIWWWDIPAGNNFSGSCSFIFSFIHQEGWPWVALTSVCTVLLCHYSNERYSMVFHLILPQCFFLL